MRNIYIGKGTSLLSMKIMLKGKDEMIWSGHCGQHKAAQPLSLLHGKDSRVTERDVASIRHRKYQP